MSISMHRPPGVALTADGRRRVDHNAPAGLDRADIPTARQLTESLQKYTTEFVSDSAVKDEVNGAVDVD